MYSSAVMAVILLLICVPGVWTMSKHGASNLANKPDQAISEKNAFTVMLLQSFIIINLSISAGIFFGGRIGLTDPFLEGLGQGVLDWRHLIQQVCIGTLVGIVCAWGWISSYYGFIRPRMDTASVEASEQLRQQLGLVTRITSGGITEEVIFRWGLLSFAMWAIMRLLPSETLAFWLSIIITGVLFGLAHLPGYIEKGCVLSPMLITVVIVGNLWVSILCGYVFWQYGIIAAIIVHMLFHILWYPWELRYNRPSSL